MPSPAIQAAMIALFIAVMLLIKFYVAPLIAAGGIVALALWIAFLLAVSRRLEL